MTCTLLFRCPTIAVGFTATAAAFQQPPSIKQTFATRHIKHWHEAAVQLKLVHVMCGFAVQVYSPCCQFHSNCCSLSMSIVCTKSHANFMSCRLRAKHQTLDRSSYQAQTYSCVVCICCSRYTAPAVGHTVPNAPSHCAPSIQALLQRPPAVRSVSQPRHLQSLQSAL